MEFYTLNSSYQQETLIQDHESYIWTERFSGFGDFVLDVHSTQENRNKYKAGTRLGMKESKRVMIAEFSEDKIDEEGKKLLTVKGRSIEAILLDRIARAVLTDIFTDPKWVIEGLPAAIARQIFHDVCVTGVLDTADIIPLIHEDSSGIFPADTIAEPTESITYEIEPKEVYNAIKPLCDQYGMGFRLFRNDNEGELWFDIYMGCDRTTRQTTFDAVVFSPDLDNLKNITELKTVENYKNVAYVISAAGFEKVTEPGVDPDISGFDRRIMVVLADDIDDLDAGVATDRMVQRGREELAKNRRLFAFDGEIDQHSAYKYGVDYHLGDLITQRNDDGATNIMQVTEQIFVSDKEGERSYPTLAVNEVIQPGTWLSWDPSEEWSEMTTEEWEDLP